MLTNLKAYLRENGLYLGVVSIIGSLLADHYLVPFLWVLVGSKVMFLAVGAFVHLNAFVFFLGSLLVLLKLIRKKRVLVAILFTLLYFIGGAFLLAWLIYLPFDTWDLLSQILRWPLIVSYIFF